MEITMFDDLNDLLVSLPEGTMADVLPTDLESGNFEEAHFELPDGSSIDVAYSGN